MKTCLTLIWLAISLALPTFAQEQSAVDPETRQEIEAVAMQFVEAYSKHDAAATAALYTEDAVRVLDWGGSTNFFGPEAIEKGIAADFAATFPPVVRKLLQMYAFEDRIVTISEYSAGIYHGNTMRIYVRDADSWKIRMEFVTTPHLAR
jgi:uncharacterized protein (TIGR02246 family)